MMGSFAIHVQVLTLVLLIDQTATRYVSTITERQPATSLRGGLPGIILSELDPNWWKATTSTASPSTSAQPTTTAAGAAGQSQVGASTPNIPACTHYLNVPGNVNAIANFWKSDEMCRDAYQQPGGLSGIVPTFISITFGTVTDYFRPVPGSNEKICSMFFTPGKFQWSKDGETWVTPTYTSEANAFGGSAPGWPTTQDPADKRSTLPFWGSDNTGPGNSPTFTNAGGCGYEDKSTTACSWNMPFKVGFCGVPQEVVPVCTGLTVLNPNTKADTVFWEDACKAVPLTASYVKMVVGYWVDYFRPPTGKTYCDMLATRQSVGDLRWSNDGESWITPEASQYTGHKEMGGSWQKLNNTELRPRVNFWGKQDGNKLGSCCYHGKTPGNGAWQLPLTMYYCENPVKPSIAEMVSDMKQTETNVKNLELGLETLHTRLLKAEETSVHAAGNVSLARQGMFKLASRFKDEADQMKEVQSIAAISETKLNSVQSNLIGGQKTIRGIAQNLASTAGVANKSASPQDKQRQEDLHTQIWDLLDPSKDDSLVATEKQVDDLYDEVSKFKTKLGNDVKTVMVTKMRQQVQKFRDAIMRLGSAARKGSASTLGDPGDSSGLGDDLGLNDDE